MNIQGRSSFGPARGLLAALSLMAAASLAQAQYSYAELDVYAPASEPTNPALRPCNVGAPTTMNAAGDAMGSADLRSGTMIDWSSLKIVPAYKRVVLKWSGAASGLVTPAVVTTTVVPLYMNNLGNWAGYIPAKTTFPKCQSGGVVYLRDTPAVQIGSKATKLNYGVNGINFEVRGINNKNWVLGSTLDAVGNMKGLIWKDGKFTELDSGGAQKVFPLAINDNGDVVGYIVPNKDPEQWVEYAVLWVGNQIVWRGPANSQATAINASGDVHWLQQGDAWQPYLRAGGVDTPVPFRGALSSRRTVIGMGQHNPNDSIDLTPAIWSASGIHWVFDEIRQQGSALPCDPRNTGSCESSTIIEQTEPEGRRMVVSSLSISTLRYSGKRYYLVKGLP